MIDFVRYTPPYRYRYAPPYRYAAPSLQGGRGESLRFFSSGRAGGESSFFYSGLASHPLGALILMACATVGATWSMVTGVLMISLLMFVPRKMRGNPM